jgi:regulator of sigma E protease
LGFGKPLVKTEWGGTTYQIAPILVGGYVKPAGEEPESGEQIAAAKPDEFMGRPWWSRVLVALAGPLTNLALPFAILGVIYATAGRLDPQGPPQVAAIFADSGAAAAGIQPGDRVVKVNGEQINGISQLAGLVDRLSRASAGKPLEVDLLRAGKPLRLEVRTTLNSQAGKYLMGVSVEPGPPPFTTTLLAPEVMSPAEKAGFKAGDVVLAVDGKPLDDGFAFSALFAGSAHDPVPVLIRRGGRELTVNADKKQPLPEEFDPALVGLLGLDFAPAGSGAAQRTRLAPLPAFKAAAYDTVAMGLVIVIGLKDLFSGRVKAREALGGPVAILRMASQQAERGWDALVSLMCEISVMLGLMNLLPVPILDGGTVLLCLAEGVRGRPLKFKTQVLLQNIGFGLVGLLFALTLVNDLLHWMGR